MFLPGRRSVRAVVCGVALASLLACRPAAIGLEVRDLDDGGRLVVRLPIEGSDYFDLSFTHSMYGGLVTERYQVGDAPRLLRTRVFTETGGAAEYYARYGNFRQVHDGWIVDAPPMWLDRVPLRVDRVGQPQLAVGNRSLELLALVGDGRRVELRAIR